jgi:hypothetical protein
MVFPTGAPPDHRRPWFVQTMLGSFCVNLSFSGLVVLEKIFKMIHPIFAFLWFSTLWRGPNPLICTDLNSLHPSMICYYLNEIGLLFLENIKKKISEYLLSCYYLPLRKGIALYLYNCESPLPKDDLCLPWLRLAQRFWRRSRKCKSLTDRRRSTGDQKSSLELSAQVS